MLIETLYGYSKEWILEGREPKKIDTKNKTLTPLQYGLITEVEKMTDDEILSVYTYIKIFRQTKNIETITTQVWEQVYKTESESQPETNEKGNHPIYDQEGT